MANFGAVASGYRVMPTGERHCLQTSVAVVRLSGGPPMTQLSFWTRVRHLLIASRWKRWLFPTICIIPYFMILAWLLTRGLIWVSQVLLAPLLMGAILALLTFWLAKAEFRTQLRKR